MEPRRALQMPLHFLTISGALTASFPAGAQPPPAPPALAGPVMPAPDALTLALAPQPGGLTPEQVANVVAQTKHSVRGKEEDVKAAAARVDQAFAGYVPRISLSATYTRLSPVAYLPLGSPIVATVNQGPVTTGPCPATSTAKGTCLLDSGGVPAVSVPLTVAVPPLNSAALVASINVPVSDYVLRLTQSYAAASHNERSARHAADAESLQARAEAKITYFNWVRARGFVVVAQEAIDQSRVHLGDAMTSLKAGLASRADVLRIDAQVAAAQQAYADSVAYAAVAEEQLRALLGVPADQGLVIGSDVMNEPATPPSETLQVLEEQAFARRLEVRSLDEAIASLRKVESVVKAGYAPRVDAFGDLTYANPNPRIFPQADAWNGTWDLGLRLSWTLNDALTTSGAAAEAKARTASLVEQRGAVLDVLRIEVAGAYADLVKAAPTLEAVDREMVSAAESLRVRRALFRSGEATSAELVDAEGEVTRAQQRRLAAHVGMLAARVRLDHATGRDAPAKPVDR